MQVVLPQRAAGRPSKYHHVDRASLYRWAAAHEDFAQALARALTCAQAWWEDDAQQSLESKHYQAEIWRASMTARFKDDYGKPTCQIHVVDLRRALDEV